MVDLFKKRGTLLQPPGLGEQPSLLEARLPNEVIALLSLRAELNSPELSINVLDLATSAKMTSSMQSISVGKHLGLVVLDDANDSNPYCYITGGVAAGMVVHFNHDPEPRIEFESLPAFEGFLRSLHAGNLRLGEVGVESPAHSNQVALAAVLSELARATEGENSEFLLCLYLPLLRGRHGRLLERLGAHESFFVREALAEAIRSAQLPESGAVVHALIADPHPQVRSAAINALEVIKNWSS